MNITPYKESDSPQPKEQAKDVLCRGIRIPLASIPTGGYSCFISRVDDGPETQNFGTLIFVHNVTPEQHLEEGK